MQLNVGDVIAYTPAGLFRRDGYAIVRRDYQDGGLQARDTFSNNETTLTDDELATAQVLFSLNDFDERSLLDPFAWEDDDFIMLPCRKGMDIRKWVRIGAIQVTEDVYLARKQAKRAEREAQALATLLSPTEHKELVAKPLPELTVAEQADLADTLAWIGRAQANFSEQLTQVARIQNGGEGNEHFAIVLADDDHYELYRARHTLETKLARLRKGQNTTVQ